MNNLPPNVKPHDSDPPEQKFLAGKMVALVSCSMSFGIIPSDHCENTREAAEFMGNYLKGYLRQARIRLDCEDIEIRLIKFEPN